MYIYKVYIYAELALGNPEYYAFKTFYTAYYVSNPVPVLISSATEKLNSYRSC